MRLLIILTSLLFVINARAQILIADPGSPDFYGFNPDFIKTTGLDSIEVEHHIKKRNMPMESLEEFGVMLFNKEGFLILNSKIGVKSSGADTNSISYEYFDEKVITSEFSSSGEVRYEILETFSDGNLVSKERVLTGKHGESELSIIETYEINWLNDTVSITTVLNSMARPYRRITRNYDATGNYLLSEVTRNIIGNKKIKKEYFYTEMGILERVVNSENDTYKFEYNSLGELKLIEIYSGGELMSRKEFIYSESGKLSAELLKFEDSPTVFIKKFRY